MFEYKTVTIAKSEADRSFEENLDDKLNEYGKDGWELVTLHPLQKKTE